jgi:large subunit ribosomal protein L18
MNNAKVKRDARLRRHRRVRRRVVGTAERPRLAVFRSNKQIYAQLIDDRAGRTLAAAGSPTAQGDGDKKAAASRVGAELATKAKAAGITSVVFDRGGYQYQGRVRALAEAAREGGLPVTTGAAQAGMTPPSPSSKSGWSRSTAWPRS